MHRHSNAPFFNGPPGITGLSREKKKVGKGFPEESRLACGLREGDVTKSSLRTSSSTLRPRPSGMKLHI